jgi:hypothetical protein
LTLLPPKPVKSPTIDAVTETPGRVDGPAALFAGRSWVYLIWWLCAWNAAVPIRFVGMILDRPLGPAPIGPVLGMLILDQTSWAVVTYVMFLLALQARRYPLRRVVTVLGLLAVPLMVLRYYADPRGPFFEFQVDGQGKVTGLTLERGAQRIPLERK